jgi:hypothetical protein
MIVVEGPDGAGKSTLISKLREKHPEMMLAPRACTSLAGPLSGQDLVQWLRDYGVMPGYIYDRHPCISGPVYDAVYADPVEGWVGAWVQCHLHELIENAKVIYCRPPRREIIKSINESAQMDGVDRKIHQIIDTYDAIMGSMIPHERYDWTKDGLPSW